MNNCIFLIVTSLIFTCEKSTGVIFLFDALLSTIQLTTLFKEE